MNSLHVNHFTSQVSCIIESLMMKDPDHNQPPPLGLKGTSFLQEWYSSVCT